VPFKREERLFLFLRRRGRRGGASRAALKKREGV